jgi:two-component system, sensor histidine kinase and response regulator
VQVDPLPTVTGHAALLALLFQNLLSNAVKFVPSGRQPQVQVCWEPRAAELWLGVRDNGIGIAEPDQQRLFQPFVRLHPRHVYDGTGLGLSLCTHVAQAHGGRLALSSAEGAGSTFWLVLQLDARCPPADEPPATAGSAAAEQAG